jgi:hypothetical protein
VRWKQKETVVLNRLKLRRTLALVALAGAGLAGWFWFAADKSAIGRPAPEIVGKDLDGRPMRLSDFRGKIVMLDFWGDW